MHWLFQFLFYSNYCDHKDYLLVLHEVLVLLHTKLSQSREMVQVYSSQITAYGNAVIFYFSVQTKFWMSCQERYSSNHLLNPWCTTNKSINRHKVLINISSVAHPQLLSVNGWLVSWVKGDSDHLLLLEHKFSKQLLVNKMESFQKNYSKKNCLGGGVAFTIASAKLTELWQSASLLVFIFHSTFLSGYYTHVDDLAHNAIFPLW